MKEFLYCCESDSGHVHWQVYEPSEFEHIVSRWMRAENAQADQALIDWMATANVGALYEHRQGVCIRLEDVNHAKR